MDPLAALAGIQQELSCSLCHQPMKDPQTFKTSCGHTFCRDCVISTLEGPGIVKSQCPTCKQPGWKKDLQTNHKYTAIAEAAALLTDVVRKELLAGFGFGLPDHICAEPAAAPQPAVKQPAAVAVAADAGVDSAPVAQKAAEQCAFSTERQSPAADTHTTNAPQCAAVEAAAAAAAALPEAAAAPEGCDPTADAAELGDTQLPAETLASTESPAVAEPGAAAVALVVGSAQHAASPQHAGKAVAVGSASHPVDASVQDGTGDSKQTEPECQQQQQQQQAQQQQCQQPPPQAYPQEQELHGRQEQRLQALQQPAILQDRDEQLPGCAHWQFQQLLATMLQDASILQQQQCMPVDQADQVRTACTLAQQQQKEQWRQQQHADVQLPESFYAALEKLPAPSGATVLQLQQDMAHIDALLSQIDFLLATKQQEQQQQQPGSVLTNQIHQQGMQSGALEAERASAAVQSEHIQPEHACCLPRDQVAGSFSIDHAEHASMIEQQPSSMAAGPASAAQAQHITSDQAAAAMAAASGYSKRRRHRPSQRSSKGVGFNQRTGGSGNAGGAGCAVSGGPVHVGSGRGVRHSLDGAFDTAIAALRATSQQEVAPALAEDQQHVTVSLDLQQQQGHGMQHWHTSRLQPDVQQGDAPWPVHHSEQHIGTQQQQQQQQQQERRRTRSTSRQAPPELQQATPGSSTGGLLPAATVTVAAAASARSRRSCRVAAACAAAAAGRPNSSTAIAGSGVGRQLRGNKAQQLADDGFLQAVPFALIGCQIEVFWPADQEYYLGEVVDYDPKTEKFKVKYPEDSEEEDLALLKEGKWRLVSPESAEELQKQQQWHSGAAQFIAATQRGIPGAAAAGDGCSDAAAACTGAAAAAGNTGDCLNVGDDADGECSDHKKVLGGLAAGRVLQQEPTPHSQPPQLESVQQADHSVPPAAQHHQQQQQQQQRHAPQGQQQQQEHDQLGNRSRVWPLLQVEQLQQPLHQEQLQLLQLQRPYVPRQWTPNCRAGSKGHMPKAHAASRSDCNEDSSSLSGSDVTSGEEDEFVPSEESLSSDGAAEAEAAAAAGRPRHMPQKQGRQQQRQWQQQHMFPAQQQGRHMHNQLLCQPQYQQQHTCLPGQTGPCSKFLQQQQRRRRKKKSGAAISDTYSSSSLHASDVTSGGESEFAPSDEASSSDEADDAAAAGLGNFIVDSGCESDREVAAANSSQDEFYKSAAQRRKRSRCAPKARRQQHLNGKRKQQQGAWQQSKQRRTTAERQQHQQRRRQHEHVPSDSDKRDAIQEEGTQQQQQQQQRQRSRFAAKQQQQLLKQQQQWELQRQQEQEDAWQALMAQEQQQQSGDEASSDSEGNADEQQPGCKTDAAGGSGWPLAEDKTGPEHTLSQGAGQLQEQDKHQEEQRQLQGLQPQPSQELDDLLHQQTVQEQQQQARGVAPESISDYQAEIGATAGMRTAEVTAPAHCCCHHAQHCSCYAAAAAVGEQCTASPAATTPGQAEPPPAEQAVTEVNWNPSSTAGTAAVLQPAARSAAAGLQTGVTAEGVPMQNPCLPNICSPEAAAVHSDMPMLQGLAAKPTARVAPGIGAAAPGKGAPSDAGATPTVGAGCTLFISPHVPPGAVQKAPSHSGKYCDLLSDSKRSLSSNRGGSDSAEDDAFSQQQDEYACQQQQVHTPAANSAVAAVLGDVAIAGISAKSSGHNTSLACRQLLAQVTAGRQDAAQSSGLLNPKLVLDKPAAAAAAAASRQAAHAGAPPAAAATGRTVHPAVAAAAATIAEVFPRYGHIVPMVMLCGYEKTEVCNYGAQLNKLGAHCAQKVDAKYTSCVVTPVDSGGRTHYSGGTTMLKALLYKVPVVQHAWLVDSLAAGQLMPFSAKYLLQGFCTATGRAFDGGPSRSLQAKFAQQQCGLFEGLAVIAVALEPPQRVCMQALAALVKLGGASYVATARVETVAAADWQQQPLLQLAVDQPATDAQKLALCSRLLVLVGGDNVQRAVKAKLLRKWRGAEVLRMIYVTDSICSYQLLDTAGYAL